MVEPCPDVSDTRALCPSCGRLATKQVDTRTEGWREAAFTCQQGHVWTSRWLPEGVSS